MALAVEIKTHKKPQTKSFRLYEFFREFMSGGSLQFTLLYRFSMKIIKFVDDTINF